MSTIKFRVLHNIKKCMVIIIIIVNVIWSILTILEVCLTTKTVPSANNKKRSSHYFIQDAPMKFIIPFVELCTEMIVGQSGVTCVHIMLFVVELQYMYMYR